MCLHSPITLGMYVSHAAALSVQLDFVLKYLESCVQTVRFLAAETDARHSFVCSQGVNRHPGKGKDNSRMFFLSIFGLVHVCIRLGVV